MGAWAEITVATLDEAGLAGIERGAPTLDGLDNYLDAAKDTLRTRASAAMSTIYRTYAISETAFFDALSGLSDSSEQEALDTYNHLVRLLALETLAGYYQDREGRHGREAEGPLRRYRRYKRLVEAGMPHLASMVRECIASGSLTLATDSAVQETRTVWIL